MVIENREREKKERENIRERHREREREKEKDKERHREIARANLFKQFHIISIIIISKIHYTIPSVTESMILPNPLESPVPLLHPSVTSPPLRLDTNVVVFTCKCTDLTCEEVIITY